MEPPDSAPTLDASKMSTIYCVGPTWGGFSSIRHLIIFGDSYSAVELTDGKDKPTAANPLGIEFPGHTWNEIDKPNWVGHLITKYTPGSRFKPGQPLSKQDPQWAKSPLLVHDFARGGDTVDGVRRQVERSFLPDLGKKPKWAPWTATNSLFVTWVGINDCARASVFENGIHDTLFSLQEQLYESGARNYLFFDVPTIHRCPAVPLERQEKMRTTFESWNLTLREAIERFCAAHHDVSIFLFSSFKAFDILLDDPETYGLKVEDIRRFNGTVWVDHIHPTSQVHDFIANNVANFLTGIPARV